MSLLLGSPALRIPSSGQTDLMDGIGDFASSSGWGLSADLAITSGVLVCTTSSNFQNAQRLGGNRISCSGSQTLDLEFTISRLTQEKRVRMSLESWSVTPASLGDQVIVYDSNSDGDDAGVRIASGLNSKTGLFTTHADAVTLEVDIEITESGADFDMDDVKLLVQ